MDLEHLIFSATKGNFLVHASCLSEAQSRHTQRYHAVHPHRRLTYLLMALLFAVTTPLGVGVGLGIRTTYNENSATALGVQGTFESVSNSKLCSRR
jgi:hypothetical protein